MAQFMEWVDRHMIPLSKLALTVPEQTPEPEPAEDIVVYDKSNNTNLLSDIKYINSSNQVYNPGWGATENVAGINTDFGITVYGQDEEGISDKTIDSLGFTLPESVNIEDYSYINIECSKYGYGATTVQPNASDNYCNIVFNNNKKLLKTATNRKYATGKAIQIDLDNLQDFALADSESLSSDARAIFGRDTYFYISKITLTNTKLTTLEDYTLFIANNDPNNNPITEVNNLAQNCKYFYPDSGTTFCDDETYFNANVECANNVGMHSGYDYPAPAPIGTVNIDGVYFIQGLAANICIYYDQSSIDIYKYEKIQVSLTVKSDSENESENQASANLIIILNEDKYNISEPTFIGNAGGDQTIIWEVEPKHLLNFDEYYQPSSLSSIQNTDNNITPRAPSPDGTALYCADIKLIGRTIIEGSGAI